MSDRGEYFIDAGGNIVTKKKGPLASGPKSGVKKKIKGGGKSREMPKGKNGIQR